VNELANTVEKVAFRQSVLALEGHMRKAIDDGEMPSAEPDCPVTHYFSPIDPKYGCCTYARQIFMPKGTVVIGKIHKHQHLNFIMQGRVSVSTEFGIKYFQAPCVFVSEVGLKRAVFVEEDCIWCTVHMTQFSSEADLDKIEDEVIAKDYQQLGLLASTAQIGALP
jgi:hypothetical protein